MNKIMKRNMWFMVSAFIFTIIALHLINYTCKTTEQRLITLGIFILIAIICTKLNYRDAEKEN